MISRTKYLYYHGMILSLQRVNLGMEALIDILVGTANLISAIYRNSATALLTIPTEYTAIVNNPSQIGQSLRLLKKMIVIRCR